MSIYKNEFLRYGNTSELKDKINDFMEKTEGEDVLGIIVRGHIYIEYELNKLLEIAVVNNSGSVGKLSFAQKVELSYTIGLIDTTWCGAFRKMNSARNKYAHEADYLFSPKDYEDLISTFNKDAKEELYEDIRYRKFFNEVVSVISGKSTIISFQDDIRLLLSQFLIYLVQQRQTLFLLIQEIFCEQKIKLIAKLEKDIEDGII